MQLSPNESLFWYAYGEIYRVQERFDEAISAYRKAIEIDPPYAKAFQKLGLLLADRKQYDDAETVLTQAIRKEPKNPLPYLALAQVQQQQKKNARALENYEKFLDLAPKNDPDRDRAEAAVKQLKKKR